MTDFPASPDAFTVTFAANQKPNAPTIAITAQTEAVLELRLQALETNGTLATIARTATAFAAQFNVGDILGGKMEVAELVSTPQDAPVAAPDPATDAAAFALNQQRQAATNTVTGAEIHGGGQVLTANGVRPELAGQTAAFPDPAPQVVQPAPDTGSSWSAPQQASPFAAQPVPVQQPDTLQPGGLPGQTGVDPTGRPLGPWLPGLNAAAVFVTGTGRSGEWRAWADPRTQQVTQNIHLATANPADPALPVGQAKYWDWIR